MTTPGTRVSDFANSVDSHRLVDSGDSRTQLLDDMVSDILLANHIELEVATGHLTPHPIDRDGTPHSIKHEAMEAITPQQTLSRSDSLSYTDGVTKEPGSLPPFPTCNTVMSRPTDRLLARPQCSVELDNSCATYASIYRAVTSVGLPNFRGAKIPVPSNIRTDVWRQHIHNCSDAQLPDMLQYGFPAGYQLDEHPTTRLANHSSSLANPTHVLHYLQTETGHGALLGPFRESPFEPWFRSNPLLTRPKQDSDKMRVILDLSFPHGTSVNDGIPAGELDGAAFKLKLPTPHTLADRIRALGRGCLIYKIDLSRAYRQLRSDPLDWPLLGIEWQGDKYVDVAIPFGLRHGASACQRTTEAVTEIAHHDVGATAYPYIDDTAGGAVPDEAEDHYRHFLHLMDTLGLKAALAKCVPPTTQLTWIGVFYDTLRMIMRIAAHKVSEAVTWCAELLQMKVVTRKYMEKLLGKLFHAIKCTKGARRFTARLLDLLRDTIRSHTGTAPMTHGARLDALWMLAFLPSFNGVTLIKDSEASHTIEVDSCLLGAGGVCDNIGHFNFVYPESIAACGFPIASLECFNLLVAIRLWKTLLRGLPILIFSDNWAVVCAIQSGRASDPLIQSCIRELWWLAACIDIDITVRHKPGAELVLADALSRFDHKCTTTKRLQDTVRGIKTPNFVVTHDLLQPPLYI